MVSDLGRHRAHYDVTVMYAETQGRHADCFIITGTIEGKNDPRGGGY